jgi:hypothetical protein
MARAAMVVALAVGVAAAAMVRSIRGAGAPAAADRPAGPGAEVPETLVRALREVASGTGSAAISQQIVRLLDRDGLTRDDLIRAAIRYRDQLAGPDERLGSLLLASLTDIGVAVVVADGQAFDGRHHEAVGTAPTAEPDRHDLVAETVRCGYRDRERLLRAPQVIVHRWAADAGGQS